MTKNVEFKLNLIFSLLVLIRFCFFNKFIEFATGFVCKAKYPVALDVIK